MIDWNKTIIYGVGFLFLWYILMSNITNSFITVTMLSTAYHIHHSAIGLGILALAGITWKVNEEQYDWLVEVQLGVGTALIVHHFLTEGLVFIT